MVQYSHFCLITQRSSSFVGEECDLTRQLKHSTDVTRFNRYFINNNDNKKKTKKKKENRNSKHVVIRKLLHFALLRYALEKLLQFALNFSLHFESMLLHFGANECKLHCCIVRFLRSVEKMLIFSQLSCLSAEQQ